MNLLFFIVYFKMFMVLHLLTCGHGHQQHITPIKVQPAEQIAIMLKHLIPNGLSWYTDYITVILVMVACVWLSLSLSWYTDYITGIVVMVACVWLSLSLSWYTDYITGIVVMVACVWLSLSLSWYTDYITVILVMVAVCWLSLSLS